MMQAAEQPDTQPQPQAPVAEEQKSPAESMAMDEAAKEASLMLLDKLMGEERQQEAEKAEKPEKKPAAEKKSAPKLKVPDKDPQPEPEQEEAAEEPEKPAPRRRPLSAEKITEVASKAAAAATAETLRQIEESKLAQQRAAQEAAAKQQEIEVPATLKDDIERLKEVQKLHADAYKGRDLAKEFVESAKRETDYERKWRKENPGMAFDWADPEHEEFASGNAVEVDEDHLKEADRQILKEQAIREAEERFNQKYGKDLEEVRRAKAEAQLAPIRQQVDDMASKSLLEAIRPDLIEEFGKDRAKVLEELKNDAIAVEAVTSVERWSMPALDAAVRVLNNPTGYSEKSPEVKVLVEAAMRTEQIMASVPRDERPVTEDGRRFSTLKDYANMPASQRSKYYTVQDEGLVTQLIIKAAQYEAGQIKENIERRMESFAKSRGFVKSESKSSPSAPAQKPKAESAPSVRAQAAVVDVPKEESSTINGVPKAFWDAVGLGT